MPRLLVALSAAALSACAASSSVRAPATVPGPVAVAAPVPAAPVAQPAPPPKSGLDLAGFATDVRPQDDLFRFAAGGWLARTEIPADRSNFGTFALLEDNARAALRRLVEETAARPDRVYGSDAQKVGDFYASFMDVDRIAVLGAAPLAAEVARILAIRAPRDVFVYMGRSQRLGVAHPLIFYVTQDARDSKSYIASAYQSGLTMPDRDNYLAADERNVALRAALEAYVARLLALSGEADALGAARRVVALEGRLANHHWTRVQNRDPVKTYNKVTLAEAARLTPGFDWFAFLEGAAAPSVTALDINQPTYVRELARLVRGTPVADWRLYFKFRLLDSYAPYLAPDFERAGFDFRQATLRGVKEQEPRWRRGVALLDESIGELLGRLYVERNFSPESRERVVRLVDNLLKAFDGSIDELEWMSPATRAEAKRKLARFTVKIGYPDRWRDYGRLQVLPGDLAGNVRRAREFEFQRQLDKLGKPVDRSEWLITPQTVNAYYNPPMNEIVFPAAILQPPFFDPAADDAVNYGAIGGVIGHEISHGFDDQGRQYDGDGNLRDWWTFDDNARFTERAGRLVAQYSGYKVLDGRAVNGQLTLGENIGDLSGLAVAYKAYRISLGATPPPVIDGFTGPQRFFLGWAQIWRWKYRDDELRVRLLTDVHSPSEFRVNGVVANMTEFHEAFGLVAGDRLYRAPGDRVKIW
ncbi:MAG: M13 family metallopeptidase [Steroidobacteraceae bacterium]|jgi:predicted metalloendopeptidase|nr:M13 family metallopeptidase [Steroidobacteraceae bacterium]